MDAHSQEQIETAQRNLKPLNRRTEDETTAARAADQQTHKHLMKLSRSGCNRECADCTATFPGWAALPHGVFLCINCAQIHRHLGRHVSQVKAINTGTYLWYPDEVHVMTVAGNEKVNAVLMGQDAPPKPHASRSREEALDFARKKYEQRVWAVAPTATKRGTCARGNNVTDTARQTKAGQLGKGVSGMEEKPPKARAHQARHVVADLISFDVGEDTTASRTANAPNPDPLLSVLDPFHVPMAKEEAKVGTTLDFFASFGV